MSLRDEPASKQDLLDVELRQSKKMAELTAMVGTLAQIQIRSDERMEKTMVIVEALGLGIETAVAALESPISVFRQSWKPWQKISRISGQKWMPLCMLSMMSYANVPRCNR